MPWCPDCKAEYRPEYETCSDCGAALVDERQEPVMSRWERFSASPIASVLQTAGLYICLLFVLFTVNVSGRDAQPLGAAVSLFALCVFGFVRGANGFKYALMGMTLPPLIFLMAIYLSDGTRHTIFMATANLAFLLPSMVSAHFGSQWKRKGKAYLFAWIAFSAALACVPYALQLYGHNRL